MKKIAIVVLNFNGTKDTMDCLISIEKLSMDNFVLSVIVIDNGSNSKFNPDLIGTKLKLNNLKIIRNEVNLGFAGGNNVGIKYALDEGSDYILILNNDTVVDKNLIKELLKTAESDPKIGIACPKIYFAKGFEYHKNRYKENELGKIIWYVGGVIDWKNVLGSHRGVDEVDKGQYDKSESTNYATGCCMLIKKEVFEKIGLLNEKYFLYYEDADFSMRVKKSGFKIIYTPEAFLWHKNAGSAGGSGSKLQDYYTTRNRLVFGIKYAPLRSKIALLKESISLLIFGRSWQKKGIIDFYLNRFGKGSYNNNS